MVLRLARRALPRVRFYLPAFVFAWMAASTLLLAGASAVAQPPGDAPGGPPVQPPGRARAGEILRDRGIDWRNAQQRARAVERIRAIEIANRERAREKADAMGIPMRQVEPDGTVTEIMGLDAQGNFIIYATHNVNAAISSAANLLHAAPYGLDGSGVTVGVWDEGAVRSTHQEFQVDGVSRVTIKDSGGSSDHGTHVGGTIGAAGVDPASKGMAPNVWIDSYNWVSDMSEMMAAGATEAGQTNRLYVSNHSYGNPGGWGYVSGNWTWTSIGSDQHGFEPAFGRYGEGASDWDAIAYNAPYYLIFKSAGNENQNNPQQGQLVRIHGSWVNYDASAHPPGNGLYRDGYENMMDHALAKNVMTVGAVNDAVTDGQRDPAKGTVAVFSSRGPTDDGRIKPDIVANGVGVYSTSTYGDDRYESKQGTSMSTPSAAGSAALLVQLYSDLFDGGAMRASTLKGLIIHTATDLGAFGIGNPGPDYRYGWGLINVQKAADLISDHHANAFKNRIREDVLSVSVPARTYEFDWDGVSPIRVTLCWTDPAGTATTTHDSRIPRLVNDLDLKIIAPDATEYLPFVMPFVGTWTVEAMGLPATTGTNSTDNVEQVLIESPNKPGTWQIQVTHKGSLENDEQAFSLLLSGMAGLPDHTPPSPDPMTFAVPPVAGGISMEPAVLASTDFNDRTVSGKTASNIPWELDGLADPGDLTTDAPNGLFDTSHAQNHFAPNRNVDNQGPWSVPVPLSLTVPEATISEVVLVYRHFNNDGFFQTQNRIVNWSVTVVGSSSGQIGSVTVNGVASQAGTETVVFSPALPLSSSETYTLTITAEGASGGNNTGLNALSIHGEIGVPGNAESEIMMIATTATDDSGVEYYFSELTGRPGGSDSGWQESPIYLNTGLLPGTEYSYTVVARDRSAKQNTTAPSAVVSVMTAGTAPEYVVTYDANGATGGNVPVDSNSPYAFDTQVTVLGNTGSLVRTGYTFANWNTQADGSGTAYAPGATFAITADTTLYAQWIDPMVDLDTPADALPIYPGHQAWRLVFSDEFNGTAVDTNKWNIDNSPSSRAARTDRGINKWFWKPENVRLEDGNLVLDVVKHDFETMYCGSINTRNIFEPTYGFFEARVQIGDTTKDTHTAFWLQGHEMHPPVVTGDAHNGAEVDIFESAWFGDYTKSVVHIDGYGSDHKASTKQYSTPGLHAGFNVFGLEWTAGYMKIYYNGEHKVTYDGIWVPRTNEWVWLSNGASFGDIGTFTEEEVGWLTSAKFDYVRVWEATTNLPPVFTVDPMERPLALVDEAYSDTIAGSAMDPELDPIIYSKVSGPAWLTVAEDGMLSGTPTNDDRGTNTWVVQVVDDQGGMDQATLRIVVQHPADPRLLVGGALLNGDFNANPGETVTFENTDAWYNTKGGQHQVATRDDKTYDGTQNAVLNQGRGFGVDTGHVIAEGNTFDFSYVWKDDWNWVGGSDQVTVSLFVTDDDTITGARTDLVVDYSGTRQVADTYEYVSREHVYTATASDAGKILFAAIETDSAGFARLDNFVLMVHPFVVPKLPATVTLGNLSQIYDGMPRVVTATTDPAHLDVILYYAGNSWAPTNAGSYEIYATIDDATYAGSTNATLVVAQAAPQIITLPTASDIGLGQAVSASVLTGGSASVDGEFAFTDPDYVPLAGGVYAAGVTFTPEDTANYTMATGSVDVWVEATVVLPFMEDFEALELGDLAGQNGWEASGAIVQTNVVREGLQAAEIIEGEGFVRRTFVDEQTNVWTDVHYQPAFFDGEPGTTDADVTTFLVFNTDGNPVVYDGQEFVTFSDVNVNAGEWVRVTVRSDYVAKTWDLYIDTDLVAEGLGFYDATAAHYREFSVAGAGSGTVPIDDILIDLESPFDQPTYYTLTVISAHGDPVPSAGLHTYDANALVEASQPVSVIEEGHTQYVVTGWAGTGSGLTGDEGTNVSFTITEDTTLQWQWQTNYWINFEIIGE